MVIPSMDPPVIDTEEEFCVLMLPNPKVVRAPEAFASSTRLRPKLVNEVVSKVSAPVA